MANVSQLPKSSIHRVFKSLTDPRTRKGRIRHPLINIIVIALCGTIAGADDFPAIVAFAQAKRQWLAKFLKIEDGPHGIPSHDTLERVFSALDPIAFQKCLIEWTQALHQLTAGKVIAIDGKAVREAMNRSTDKGPLCLVTAWASENSMMLGQVAGPAGSNELGALPVLLDLLDLKGAIVTIDAIGCQKNLVEQIIDGEGDYVISVKGNQETLYELVQQTINDAIKKTEFTSEEKHTTTGKGHGRTETREVIVVPAPTEMLPGWKGLNSFVRVVRTAIDKKGVETVGTRYYVSSLECGAADFGKIVRNHWSIENQLHWQLDMSYCEDLNRARRGNAPANLGILRRVSLSLIKNSPMVKGSIKCIRQQAGWSDEIQELILFGAKIE